MGAAAQGPESQVRATSVVSFEDRAAVDAPIGDVFARLIDLPRYREWMHRTGLFRRCAWTADRPPAVGAQYADSTRMGTFRGEVTELDPPSGVEFRETLRWPGGARADARMEYVLEANHGGTAVHHVAQTELTGWMRLMKPVARLMVRSERKRTLRSLSRSFR
jgi:uncharacterized protein YndB with AHSA1/START domain